MSSQYLVKQPGRTHFPWSCQSDYLVSQRFTSKWRVMFKVLKKQVTLKISSFTIITGELFVWGSIVVSYGHSVHSECKGTSKVFLVPVPWIFHTPLMFIVTAPITARIPTIIAITFFTRPTDEQSQTVTKDQNQTR